MEKLVDMSGFTEISQTEGTIVLTPVTRPDFKVVVEKKKDRVVADITTKDSEDVYHIVIDRGAFGSRPIDFGELTDADLRLIKRGLGKRIQDGIDFMDETRMN